MNVMRNLDCKKLVQFVNLILSKNDFRLNYTKLIKLMYLSDREAIKRIGSPISEDSYFALPKGPVLSTVLDLIKTSSHAPSQLQVYWDSRFETDGNDIISLHKDAIGVGELCDEEIDIVTEVEKKYHSSSWQEIVNTVLHKPEFCPEWTNPGGASSPIPLKDVFLAVGLAEEDFAIYQEEKAYMDRLDQWISAR